MRQPAQYSASRRATPAPVPAEAAAAPATAPVAVERPRGRWRAAVGRVGFEHTTTFTAVGEVVNTASRLQEYTKSAQARLVLSLEVARRAGVADGLGEVRQVQVRGRSEPLQALHVARPGLQWP